MATIELSVEARATSGKRGARQARRSGRVPAVFYGPRRGATTLSMEAKEFATKVMSLEGSHLIRFASSEPELAGKVALVRETQVDALTGAVTHADFYEVDMSATIRVPVPIHLVGKAAGVVNGGILQPIVREVQVECLPDNIPEFVEVDVSALGIHDSIHVSALTLPSGVTPVFESDYVIVTVAAPSALEAKGEGGAGAAAEGGAAAAPAKAAPAKGGDAKGQGK